MHPEAMDKPSIWLDVAMEVPADISVLNLKPRIQPQQQPQICTLCQYTELIMVWLAEFRYRSLVSRNPITVSIKVIVAASFICGQCATWTALTGMKWVILVQRKQLCPSQTSWPISVIYQVDEFCSEARARMGVWDLQLISYVDQPQGSPSGHLTSNSFLLIETICTFDMANQRTGKELAHTV